MGRSRGSSDAPPEDSKLLAERQILQGQGGSATEDAAKNERNGPHKGHPYLPLELPGLVEIELREYAGQVPETQAWCGRSGFREGQACLIFQLYPPHPPQL